MIKINVAVVGARGFVGVELLQLLDIHPLANVVAAFSREYQGKSVSSVVENFSDKTLCYQNSSLESLRGMSLDVIFLALPNEIAKKHALLWQQLSSSACIIDLSSDFRFDSDWAYGQPETCAEHIIGQTLIANPGCYATAAQLSILPILGKLDGVPNVFGVSGYSGAGSKPSPKNNKERLKDNLMAYQLINHIHEQEVSHVLQQKLNFMPHVASFFRGIHLTISVSLNQLVTHDAIISLYEDYYQGYELIKITSEIPEVKDIQHTHYVNIGGFNIEQKHLVFCATIDNLLKGAATQAIQNMNLALSQSHKLTINTGIIRGKEHGQ